MPPPSPLRKHSSGPKSPGKITVHPVLRQRHACARHTWQQSTRGPPTLCKVWYNAQAILQIFCLSLSAVGGIRCHGLETLSNLPPHLEQWDMLALRSWLGSRFCSRLRHRFGLPILWHKAIIHTALRKKQLVFKNMAQSPNTMNGFCPHNLHFIIPIIVAGANNSGRRIFPVRDSHAGNSNVSHG